MIGINYTTTSPLPPMWMDAIGALPANPAEIDAWLRKYMQFLAEQRMKSYPDYKIPPASVASRTIGGHMALTRSADFTNNNEKWTEHLTSIAGEKVIAQFQLQAPAAQSEAVHAAFNAMIETLRLP